MGQRIITLALSEHDLPLVRHIDAAKIMNNADGAGYDPEGSAPLSPEEAKALLDSNGYASAVIEVDIERFAQGLTDATVEYDVYDVLHDIAFGFGLTEDSDYEVLGVTGDSSSLIIRYTTHLSPFLGDKVDEGASA